MEFSKDHQVLKGLLKINSAINNVDELLALDGFGGKLGKDLRRYVDFYVHHTCEVNRGIAEANFELYHDIVYNGFSEIDSSVQASSDVKKHLSLFFAKMLSALRDFKTAGTDYHTRLLVGPLVARFKPLAKDRRLRHIEVNMDDFWTLTKVFDRFGDELIG